MKEYQRSINTQILRPCESVENKEQSGAACRGILMCAVRLLLAHQNVNKPKTEL